MSLEPFSDKFFNEFLSSDEDNLETLLDRLRRFIKEIKPIEAEKNFSRRKLKKIFNYDAELQNTKIPYEGTSTDEIIAEFNEMISGCIRPHSPSTAFNIMPSPLFDIAAALSILNLYNPNVLWDFPSGNLCLFEKKIIKSLGRLVNWEKPDGFVVTGGKQSLMYAIKCGIGRVEKNSTCELGDMVVICSELAHYSIEHVCHFLGISKENCVRVKALKTGEMDVKALKMTLESLTKQGKYIAAVIAVGGGTVNLIPDDILSIKKTLQKFKNKFTLNYAPYLHVDSVTSWSWLTFNMSDKNLWKKENSSTVVDKVEKVLNKLNDIEFVDSFAADFHKTGFCPYAAGVFITKNKENLSGLSLADDAKNQTTFFQEEMHKKTLENSRSAAPIVSIWLTLKKMGFEGLKKFVLYQLNVCESFKKIIKEKFSTHFEIINEHSGGWEIVIKPHFKHLLSWDDLQTSTKKAQKAYKLQCLKFLNKLWIDQIDKSNFSLPLLGYIKSYSRKGSYEKSFPALLIHPCSLHYNEQKVEEMLFKLVKVKIDFDNELTNELDNSLKKLQEILPPK